MEPYYSVYVRIQYVIIIGRFPNQTVHLQKYKHTPLIILKIHSILDPVYEQFGYPQYWQHDFSNIRMLPLHQFFLIIDIGELSLLLLSQLYPIFYKMVLIKRRFALVVLVLVLIVDELALLYYLSYLHQYFQLDNSKFCLKSNLFLHSLELV